VDLDPEGVDPACEETAYVLEFAAGSPEVGGRLTTVLAVCEDRCAAELEVVIVGPIGIDEHDPFVGKLNADLAPRKAFVRWNQPHDQGSLARWPCQVFAGRRQPRDCPRVDAYVSTSLASPWLDAHQQQRCDLAQHGRHDDGAGSAERGP
jgi:hypothetical protein